MVQTLTAKVQQSPVLAAAVVALVLTVLVVGLNPTGNAVERRIIGTWTCTGAHTDTDRSSGEYERTPVLPDPFTSLSEEADPMSVTRYDYRDPRSATAYLPFSPTVTVHPDGRFKLTGLDLNDGSDHRGSWAIEDGLVVARFDNPDIGAVAIHPTDDGQPQALVWDGGLSVDIHRLAVTDDGADTVDVRFSTGVTGYVVRCSRTTAG